jgi:hypothetical protein
MGRSRKLGSTYNVFLHCVEIAESEGDQYWVDVFTQLSRNKPPKRFIFRENERLDGSGKLLFKKGNKYETLEVTTNAKDMYPLIINFLHIHGGLASELDNNHVNDSLQVEDCEITWQLLSKKRATREQLLMDYVNKLSQLYYLTQRELIQLKLLVDYGLSTKRFNKDNIIMKDYAINQIMGLYFNSTERCFTIDPTLKAKKTTRANKFDPLADPFGTPKSALYEERWTHFIDLYGRQLLVPPQLCVPKLVLLLKPIAR